MRTFCVAGHRFSIELPERYGSSTALEPYLPFEDHTAGHRIFTLHVGDARECSHGSPSPARRFNEEAPYIWVCENDDMPVFGFSVSPDEPDFLLCADRDFRNARVILPAGATDCLLSFALANSTMLMYMLAASGLDTLLIHASTVVHEGLGYAFTGRSSSGKSTHSRLWLDNIEGCMLLNDDNPVVRILDGKAVIYGSPWSGKTACYKNAQAPLKAIVHIFQAPANSIERLSGIRAYASFITSCSNLRWDRKVSDGINACVEKLLTLCGFYNLHCLPDREAALLCRRTVSAADILSR